MLIGITGRNGAGKDTAAEYLTTKSFYHSSLSDIIREDARRRNMRPTRANLVQLGNRLREISGTGVLA